MHTLLYFKRIANKDLLYNTRNSAQCGSLDRREFEEEGLHIYVWLGKLSSALELSQHC